MVWWLKQLIKPSLRENPIDQFRQDLDEAVAETESSKTVLLQLMMKVRENSGRQLNAMTRHVDDLARPGQGVGSGISPLVSHTSLLPGITADTSFGRAQVGGVEMDLTINAMFGLIRSLKGKVQILSDRTKNTGIHFGDLAYASEKEFALANHAANPSGAGIAGFVDFISFWNFSAQLAIAHSRAQC